MSGDQTAVRPARVVSDHQWNQPHRDGSLDDPGSAGTTDHGRVESVSSGEPDAGNPAEPVTYSGSDGTRAQTNRGAVAAGNIIADSKSSRCTESGTVDPGADASAIAGANT